ncbi:MAG TPA: NIPSNAP family protein [Vicinamibacterales bacterium]
MKTTLLLVVVAALSGFAAARATTAVDSRVFELRTYHAAPGKLDALHARFRDHTNDLFKKHGMTVVGYWVPTDAEKGAGDTLIYILAFADRAAATAAWKAFATDPDWMKVKAESEKDGPLTTKIDSVFTTPTDYSPMK